MTAVMWFRRDLRVQDNKALYHACHDAKDLILLFQVNPEQFIAESANHQAFFASVAYFKKQIDQQAHVQILYGDPIESFKRLKKQVPDWDAIYFNEDEAGNGARRDEQAQQFFAEQGIESHTFQDAYLHGVQQVQKPGGEPYKVFTPYYKKWCEQPKETPYKVAFDTAKIQSQTFFPEDEQKFADLQQPFPKQQQDLGEQAALQRLSDFIEQDLADYERARDIPSLDQTSHFSRYLRTGELAIRTVWQALQQTEKSASRTIFEKELCWRDFYNMIFASFPDQKEVPIQANFRYIEWENDQEKFKRWQEGKTGFPIIDAAMRQLQQTGWMHNRLRMVTASFLTKDLLIDWRLGEKYFQKMLIDYAPASNIGGWQWAASTGTDAVPYFRIFNPITQSQKYDPKGKFIRQYVTELANVPDKWIHQPEKMNQEQQNECGVILGKDYPLPLVDHKEQRQKALSRYEFSKEQAQERQG